MDLKEIEQEGIDCKHLAQDIDQWWVLENRIMIKGYRIS
jgi:hypothetical protein